MGGFGQKKKENKSSSRKLLKLSENDLKVKSINSHIKGNLDEAEKGYIAFQKNGFYDPDILSNYALLCEGRGENEKAIKLYEKCISNSPNHIFSKINLSFLYYKLNNFKKAEKIINEAINLKPRMPNGYCIRGLILKSLDKYDESRISLEKAIEIDSDYFDAYINLGLLHKDYNNFKDAEKYYLKAIELNNKSAIAHLNLGACYKESLKLDKAILHTEIAIKLDSKLENSYLNLATIYNQIGDYNKSFEYAKEEISNDKNSELGYQLISELIKKIEPKRFLDENNRELIKNILNRKDISHRELFRTINNLVPTKVLERLSVPDFDLNDNREFSIIKKDKVLIKALSLIIFCSPLWEQALRNIRKIMLLNYSEKENISDNVLNFTIALGEQCFLNEYVYYVSDEEKSKLEELKKSIQLNNRNQDYKLSLISCYQSLSSINNKIINLTNYKPIHKEFNKLLDSQFREIAIENNLANKIKKIGNISDLTSMEVKNQYESNPYPRWRYNSYAKEKKINFLSVINSEIYPDQIKSNQIKLTNKKINILIAGCGTGIQILEASRYRNCEITAIDLSNSSICYAKRKVDEYGMKNVDFIEMDLLELKKLNKQFDLIECSGVLHHMKDPTKGLSVLIDSLEANGFLKLGLYSKLARKEILKARQLISEKDIQPSLNEIRIFRDDVIKGKIEKINQITNWSDFYSTSMCRDLCFHSQEKCYTLIEIKNILKISKLEFLGFTTSNDIKDKYQRKNKAIKSLYDLDLWDKFEQLNPNSFREMYQFWTRKSIE